MDDKIVNIIIEMNESEAKDTLARIFRKMGRVNGINYTQQNCYEDIENIFREKVVGKMMNLNGRGAAE